MLSAIKQESIVDNSHSLRLSDLPFESGEKVVVFVMSKNALQTKLKKWQDLFKKTQALKQTKKITVADIDAEIEEYRLGL